MERKVHYQLLNDALKALVDKRLNDAHIIIRSLCKDCGADHLTNRFESIESDYHAMLDFVARGGVDQSRDENLSSLYNRTFQLLSTIRFNLLFSEYAGHFPEKVADTMEAYWIGSPDAIHEMLHSMPFPNEQSLMGLVLALMVHPEVFELSPELAEDTKRLFSDEHNQNTLLYIYNEIFLSSQAERIEQHMKDEMMPMMLEAAKDRRLQQEMTEQMTESDEEEDSFEKLMKQQELEPLTPEQRRKKKLLNSAMNELMDIHNEGIDINTEIFNFAARLPFFGNLSNWFIEFDPHHPAIEPICYPNGKPNILFRMLYDVPSVCDIDKYAMTFIMGKKFKSDKMNLMISDLQNIISESEALKDMDFILPQKSTKDKITDFIHTLYRFVTKSRWKSELPNVFGNELPFCTNDILSIPLRKNPKAAIELADKMWKFRAKDAAVKMYRFIDSVSNGLDTERSLRIFRFYDDEFKNEGDEYVERAFANDPTDRDVLYAMSRKYQRYGDSGNKVKMLKTLIDLYPEDTKAILDLANTYVIMENWQDANQQFFKLEYLGKKVVFAQRGIIHCSLNLMKFDVALRYSRKLFNTLGTAEWIDYLRGGHAAWLMNDMTSALTFYHLYIKNYLEDSPTITDALAPFNEDIKLLKKLGKSSTDISLMRDMISLKAI